MTYLLHVANAFSIVAFLVKDILWLRALSITGGVCMVTAYVARTPPMWDGAGWDALFVAINVVQIGLLVAARRPVRLTGDEQALYQATFRALTAREFKQLADRGIWQSMQTGTHFIEAGKELETVRVIASGEVEVCAGDRVLSRLGPGQFVGEMAFLSSEQPSVDVVAATDTRCLAWPAAALKQALTNDAELRAHVQTILGVDLARKLRAG